MTVKKYLLCPGPVLSANDGDRHWIGAPRLAQLYGVPMSECLVDYGPPWSREHRGSRATLIHLAPRYDGKYREALARLEERP